MPAYIKQLTSTGLYDVNFTAESIKEVANHAPGIYTITNTYNQTQTLMLDAHLDRLEDSAEKEHIPLSYSRSGLKTALQQMILDADFGDVRFCITVPYDQPDSIIIALEPFTPPARTLIENGTKCITSSQVARHNPTAKTTAWIQQRKTLEDTMPEGIYDTFLLTLQGDILEGLASNFYAIVDGELRTAGEGVLAGISQKIVFEVSKGIIPINKTAVNIRDINNFSEAFLTSSSRGIIPVVEIDAITIGDGTVGQITKQLRQAYQMWMNKHLEEL